MKSTKRPLLLSLTSLLLCVSMLLGTTYSWFTDRVTSGVSRITAGNLDVGVKWAERYDGTWYDLDDPEHNVVFQESILWEPGHTQARYFKIENKGALALKYKLTIEPAGVIGSIADVLDVTYLGSVSAEQAAAMDARGAYGALPVVGPLSSVITGLHQPGQYSPGYDPSYPTAALEGVILAAGADPSEADAEHNRSIGETVCMVGLKMQETAGNEYMNASIGEGFYITCVATQYQYEDDSFGNDYDEEVGFPTIVLPQLASESVTLDESGATTAEVTLDSGLEGGVAITATVPAGTKFESGTTEAVLSVALVSQDGNISMGDTTISRTLDVHMAGVAAGNTKPIIITIPNALPTLQEPNAVTLYHTEGGVQNPMTQKSALSDVAAHNDYYYNSTTGTVTMALASFSEILFEVSTDIVKWDPTKTATEFSSGLGTEEDPYMINTAAELAYLAAQVNSGTKYDNTYFKLGKDIVINDWKLTDADLDDTMKYSEAKDYCALDFASSSTNDPAFEQKNKAFHTWTPIGDGSHEFSGVFDGNNHTISGLFKLHYDDPMDRNPMGLFGWIHNGTVKNLTVADSFIYTYGGTVGLVAAYASGSTKFENVKVKENFVTSYNYPLGGVLGMAWQANADENDAIIDDEIIFSNVTVDNSNILEALWGTYDSAVGGVVGTAYPNTDITLNNVTVYPTMSLYNDCCANYQWFAYRYSGMLIGYVRASDRATWLANNVHCTNVVVKYGSWTDQYYCERVELGKGSYNGAHEWKYERISKDQVLFDGNGNVIGCNAGHNHKAGKAYTYKGQTYYTTEEDEDNVAINIAFHQLFGGGQGVYGETLEEYAQYCSDQGKPAPDVTVINNGEGGAELSTKFVNKDKYLYRVGNRNTVTLGTLFGATGTVNSNSIKLSAEKITGVSRVQYEANTSDWTKGTLQFTGTGVIKLKLEYLDSEPCELVLEVVDAVNYPGGKVNNTNASMSATSNNVCLLKDISVSGNASIKIDHGYSFYGNGFTISCTGNGSTNSSEGMSSGYITITRNGTLNNAKVIASDFPKAYMYVGQNSLDYYLKESENMIDANHFGYQLSAVKTENTATISNCYIYGARNNVLALGGNLTIDGCVLANGSLSNIHFNSQTGNLNLNNVTTMQYIRSFTYNPPNGGNQTSAKVIGFGVLMGPTPETTSPASNPTLNITGDFDQYNWVCHQYSDITSSRVAKDLISTAVNQTEFQHVENGTEYVNLGVVYLNNVGGTINDARNNHGYILRSVSMKGVSGLVYSLQESSGTVVLYDGNTINDGCHNSIYIPHYEIDGSIPTTGPSESDETFCWNDNNTLRIQFPEGETGEVDVSKIKYERYTGEAVTRSVSCSGSGSSVDGTIVKFSKACETVIVIKVSGSRLYDEKGDFVSAEDYTLTIPVVVTTVDKTIRNAEISCTSNSGTMIWGTAGSTFDRDYQPAAQIFDNMTITDYDDDGTPYTVLDGSNQAAFLNSIVSVVADSDNKTGFTINFPEGTKLVIKCGAPYKSGTLVFKKYDNKFLMCGSAVYNNPTAATWNVTSYTYTGRNGVAVTYGKRGFTSTTGSTNYSLTSLSTNKFLMYDAQGGSVSPTYTGTSPATLPTPTRNGYTFQNWNTKADGTGTATNAGTSMSFSSTTTLYAIWAKNVTVKFNSDGSIVRTVSGGAGTKQTLPSATQTTNWLEGWYTEETGGTKIGNAGASFTVPNSDTTYYAHWSPKYGVAYNACGGLVSASYTYEGYPADVYEGSAIILPAPTNGSKTFEGWFTEPTGGKRIGAAGDSYVPSTNIILYAQWSDNILVTFDGNGGTAGTNNATYDHVTPITLPAATRAGYAFNGWYTATSGGTKVGDAGASYTPGAAAILHAQWTAYTVTYDANGGSVSPASATGVVTLPTPTRTGYTFNGWYTATSGGTKVGDAGASYTPTKNITLHAQWTQKKFTVTIKAGSNGSVSPTSIADVPYGTTVTVSSNTLTINGTTVTATANSKYTFDKWSVSNDATITSAMTITASFKSSGGTCLTAGTLITMADGTLRPVELIAAGDMLLTWDLENGCFGAAPVVFNDADPETEYEIIHAYFDNGSDVEIISEHGFFDMELGRYVYFDADAAQYIGHSFAVADGDSLNVARLTNVVIERRVTTPYSPVTFGDLCYFTDGVLSMPGGISGLFNIFDVDVGTMRYDAEAMRQDIESYGLLTIEDFGGMITQDMFDAFNGQYLGVAVGKQNITWEQIAYLAERYAPLCD